MDHHGLLNLEIIKLIRRWLPAPGFVALANLYFLAVGILITSPVPFPIPASQVLVFLVNWAHIVSLYALPTFGHMSR